MTNPTPEQEQEAMRKEIKRLRNLAAACYAGLGGECALPDEWLDVLLAAAEGEPFTDEGLLPFESELRKSHAELLEALKDADDLIRNLVEYQGAKLSAAGESRQEHYASVIQFAKELQA